MPRRRRCRSGPGSTTWARAATTGAPSAAAEVDRLGIPGFHFSDGPRGVVVGPATASRCRMARGATWDLDLEERIGEAIGRELRAVGADLYGGVCVNVLRHPAWGRAQETYGEDPFHVGELGAALTRGVQRHAMACVKHFACNSMENARFSVDVTVDERALHEVYLPHFQPHRRRGRRLRDERLQRASTASGAARAASCSPTCCATSGASTGFVISDWIFGLRDAGAVGGRRPRRRDALPHGPRRRPAPALADAARRRGRRRPLRSTRVVATLLRFAACSRRRDPPPTCSARTSTARWPARRPPSRSCCCATSPSTARRCCRSTIRPPRVAVIGRLADTATSATAGRATCGTRRASPPLDGLRAALPDRGRPRRRRRAEAAAAGGR